MGLLKEVAKSSEMQKPRFYRLSVVQRKADAPSTRSAIIKIIDSKVWPKRWQTIYGNSDLADSTNSTGFANLKAVTESLTAHSKTQNLIFRRKLTSQKINIGK